MSASKLFINEDGVAYMTVPRCDQCKHWVRSEYDPWIGSCTLTEGQDGSGSPVPHPKPSLLAEMRQNFKQQQILDVSNGSHERLSKVPYRIRRKGWTDTLHRCQDVSSKRSDRKQ